MYEIGDKAGEKVMDLQKEREAFEKAFAQTEFYRNKADLYSLLADIDDESFDFFRMNGFGEYSIGEAQAAWSAWHAAKAESHKSASLYQLEINHLASANQQLRDYAAKSQAVPEGFVLVPKEPTREIIDALIEKIWHGYGYQEVEAHYVAIYKAMIEAQEQK